MSDKTYLAIDTSTAQISVAIMEGSQVLSEVMKIDALRHAELASQLVKECLKSANLKSEEIDVYLCGIGPGPFTGLRVGVMTAKIFAQVFDKPIYGICSHDAIAIAQDFEDTFTVITDARRKEVYATEYLKNQRINTPLVVKREAIVSKNLVENEYPLARNLINQAQFALSQGQDLTVNDFVLDEAANDGSKVKLPKDILLPAIPLYLRVPDAKPKP
ncbi:MAG: tRNA (adenosine(37)-N6)-threonylcarbamoyltransferase complex dimerization subunit type 1 TsaB [Candidatus Nanopelagicales bacterium]